MFYENFALFWCFESQGQGSRSARMRKDREKGDGPPKEKRIVAYARTSHPSNVKIWAPLQAVWLANTSEGCVVKNAPNM